MPRTTSQRLETLTRRWWLYALILLLFFLPAYSARGYDPRNTSQVITAVLSNPIIYAYPALWIVFKVLPILLIGAIGAWGDRATRVFDGYVAATLLLFALFQNMARTQEFGLTILLGNTVVYVIVAGLWVYEAIVKENDFTPRPRPPWRYWVAPAALLAFWFPVNPATLQPDFAPLRFLTNEAGLTLCMMLPVYLAVVTLFWPTINRPVVRVTAFAGMITGLLNMLQWFVLSPQPWLGILHLPMLTISMYAFGLSFRKGQSEDVRPDHERR